MRIRTKIKTPVWIVLLIVAGAVIVSRLLGLGSSYSALRMMYVGNEGRFHWSGRYQMLDGTMQKRLASQTDVLTVSVQTEEGAIDILITDSQGQVLLDEDNVATAEMQVPVSGKSTVVIKADHHRGSFLIDGRKDSP